MNAKNLPVDILLYIALNEEFDSAMAMLGDSFKSDELPDVALTYFWGSIPSPVLSRDFQVVVIPAGKMGNTRSANITSALIEKFRPANIVVLGIAGSLTNNLEPGDVFIPDSINEYLANSATHGGDQAWSFQTSGNHFQTSPRLLNRFQFFEHTEKHYYTKWKNDTKERINSLLEQSIRDTMTSVGLKPRGECKALIGDDRKLASGPAVGKGKAFLDWLIREVDRKVVAMEMESAGVYDAGIIRTPAPRIIAIRGISDYADDRKDKIETSAKELFRELAAKNALSLLLRAIEAGLFQSDIPDPTVKLSEDVTITKSRLKSVFVIGGITTETGDFDAELPRLHNASLKLGRLLAETGTQLIICSPFPDAIDYYVALGYSGGNVKGVIHLHSPSHPRVDEKRKLLVQSLGSQELEIRNWNYPGPETEEAWPQAWLLAQLQALERADLVVAIGGKISKTANTLLHLAEAKGIPIVPFAFLGGAAKRAFDRRDWKRLNPQLDTTVMERDGGIDETIVIANRLIVDRITQLYHPDQAPQTLFVSFARQDSDTAIALISFLRQRGLEVLTGDNEIRRDQMVAASIEQAILKCISFNVI